MNVVDQYAIALAQLDAAKAAVDNLKAELLARGEGEHLGAKFSVKVSSHERGSLDSAMVRELLTKKQIEKCTKYTTVTTVARPKLLAGALAA